MWLMTNFGFFSIVKKEGEVNLTVRVPREVFAEALTAIALDIDYPNFKNSVAGRQGKARARLYEDVWQRLYGLQAGDGS
ncbi:MAG: hypothetical protein A4E67_01014 [Syntrophaceae bacterium PtaB.Bin038]|nr:MAG: hypothetical protein A4E67_01014 [Syntrophaceae bacterium PtaB.Bin038]